MIVKWNDVLKEAIIFRLRIKRRDSVVLRLVVRVLSVTDLSSFGNKRQSRTFCVIYLYLLGTIE